MAQWCRAWLTAAVALVLASGLTRAAVAESAAALALPPHPRLLLDAEGVAQLKARLQNAPWARASWADLKAGVDQTLTAPVELPPRGGNWSHNYVCPIHSARLSQGKAIGPWQWEHLCPVGPHVLRGDPTQANHDFDGNAIAAVHSRLAELSIHAGLVFQVTGEARYARKAREILLAYAQRYLTYPLHDNQGRPGKGGRIASQSLTEASWLIEIAQGADLVWSTLSPAERETLAAKLLRPALDQVILPHPLGIHNIQCRHNSAIGLVGYLLGDARLIALAVDDPVRGFRQQIAKGVLGDGLWTEGSSGYHYFTIAGLWPLAEAARHGGLDLYDARFRSMFDGPIAAAMPNLVLPNFNDSGTVALAGEADLYELGYARFHNPAYLPLLAGSSRHGRLALLFGAETLPGPASAPAGASASRNLSASGYAILQRGAGRDATWLCLKYGPHGGGHGHPDKNSVVLYARGEMVGLDAGTHAYGSPLHKDWDKTTVAHNTLVVDGESQEPATGKCLAFGADQGVDFAVCEAGPLGKGVRFTRTAVLVSAQLVVFIDQIQAETAHTLDIVYHSAGPWEGLPAKPAARARAELTQFIPWMPPAVAGYTHFSRCAARTNCADSLALSLAVGSGWRAAVVTAGGEPADVIAGYGVMKTTDDLVPMLVQRRRAADTAFLWAIALDAAPVRVTPLAVTDPVGTDLRPSTAAAARVDDGYGHAWVLLANPQARSIRLTLPTGSPMQTSAIFAAKAL